MFCEKAMELIRELQRMNDGQLPAFNVSLGHLPLIYKMFVGFCFRVFHMFYFNTKITDVYKLYTVSVFQSFKLL